MATILPQALLHGHHTVVVIIFILLFLSCVLYLLHLIFLIHIRYIFVLRSLLLLLLRGLQNNNKLNIQFI